MTSSLFTDRRTDGQKDRRTDRRTERRTVGQRGGQRDGYQTRLNDISTAELKALSCAKRVTMTVGSSRYLLQLKVELHIIAPNKNISNS